MDEPNVQSLYLLLTYFHKLKKKNILHTVNITSALFVHDSQIIGFLNVNSINFSKFVKEITVLIGTKVLTWS